MSRKEIKQILKHLREELARAGYRYEAESALSVLEEKLKKGGVK
jgi:hypothetical protein